MKCDLFLKTKFYFRKLVLCHYGKNNHDWIFVFSHDFFWGKKEVWECLTCGDLGIRTEGSDVHLSLAKVYE